MSTTLPVGKAHSYDDLALYVVDEGKLVDAYKVEYEIRDASSAYPGALTAPGDTRVDVTATTGHFATGCYGVRDPGTGLPWLPASPIARGRLFWYYTLVAGGPEIEVERSFEVLAATVAPRPAHHLMLIQDAKEAGAPASFTDRALFQAIELWTHRIERYCRQGFWPKRETKRLYWRPSATLHFGSHFLGVGWMREASASVDFPLVDLVPINARGNPALRIADTYSIPVGQAVKSLVRVNAVWGDVDPVTLGAPADLAMALPGILVTILKKATPGPIDLSVGVLKREKTDGHEVEYATISSSVRTGLAAYLRSQEMRDLLDMYRAPIALSMGPT